MPLGSTWWSTNWINNFLPGAAPFDDATITLNVLSPLWNQLVIKNAVTLYQRDASYTGSHDPDNGGMFYIETVTAGERIPAAQVSKIDEGSGDELSPPAASKYDLEVFDGNFSVKFNSPFTSGANQSDYAVTLTNRPALNSGDTMVVKYVGPWAWCGTPSQAIAAMLLALEIPAAYIDTAAFDTAYDGELADHGASGVNAPSIRAVVTYGMPIIDTIKRIAAHAWTRIGYTMAGKIACWSATRPTSYEAQGIVGVKGLTTWRITEEHLCNSISATYGAASRTTDNNHDVPPTIADADGEAANPDYAYESVWEDRLQGARRQRWLVEDEDTTSQTAYGIIPVGGYDELSKPVPVHYEMFMDMESAVGAAARLHKFADPLRVVELVQDLRGLDYDVGTVVTDLVVGPETFDAICVEKTVDYNTYTVTSVLLEAK